MGLDGLVRAIKDNRVDKVITRVPVRPGDCFYLPSGALHALGAGVVVAEVQTPSDVTYRIYDWGRQGRELHVDQALQTVHADWRPGDGNGAAPAGGADRLVACQSFLIDRAVLPAGQSRPVAVGQMAVWIVLAGSGRLAWGDDACPFKPGDVILLPAAMSAATVTADDDCAWLDARVPAHE